MQGNAKAKEVKDNARRRQGNARQSIGKNQGQGTKTQHKETSNVVKGKERTESAMEGSVKLKISNAMEGMAKGSPWAGHGKSTKIKAKPRNVTSRHG
jgi:hypothetical protein